MTTTVIGGNASRHPRCAATSLRWRRRRHGELFVTAAGKRDRRRGHPAPPPSPRPGPGSAPLHRLPCRSAAGHDTCVADAPSTAAPEACSSMAKVAPAAASPAARPATTSSSAARASATITAAATTTSCKAKRRWQRRGLRAGQPNVILNGTAAASPLQGGSGTDTFEVRPATRWMAARVAPRSGDGRRPERDSAATGTLDLHGRRRPPARS